MKKVRVKRQCAHCGKILGYVYWEQKYDLLKDPDPTTHGICIKCSERLIAETVAYKEKMDSRLRGNDVVYI